MQNGTHGLSAGEILLYNQKVLQLEALFFHSKMQQPMHKVVNLLLINQPIRDRPAVSQPIRVQQLILQQPMRD